MRRTIRILLTLIVGGALLSPLVLGSPTAPLPHANANIATTSQLAQAKHHERVIEHRITRIRRAIVHRKSRLARRLPERPSSIKNLLSRMMPTVLVGQWRKAHLREINRWQRRTQAMERRVLLHVKRRRRRAGELAGRLSTVRAWIAQWGVFQTCPVRGYHELTNSFGVMVRIPGVPVHVHQGDDILSTYGTPIVAPFSGDAVASSSDLGGMAVKVYGDRGFVYNAHLERYGTLGHVSAGTVIGYVGATGDATSPHDHFEWHPGNGPAVDPYPYLSVVC